MPNEPVVDLVYILDRSGSMASLIADAVGGYNSFIEMQKKEPGVAYVTLISFDDKPETIYFRKPIKEVPTLTVQEVYPRGSTALRDAIGSTAARFEEHWNVAMFIQTDGEENASIEWSDENIKNLISQKEKAGWKFSFVGVGKGINANAQGSRLGFSRASIMAVAANSDGLKSANMSYSASATAYRSGIANAHYNS